ncbi:unnamed protein product [Callosobruchus maculatus]|uniref:Uncharacterized protein n=1 Tax=Callosobruchus maculatus TaxID=64391 RepID=A0A653D7M5_CALMS|nr:unnamed protein product [Callosobruchus maculatus]
MDGSIAGGRRRLATKSSAEDQALDQIAKEVFSQYFAWIYVRMKSNDPTVIRINARNLSGWFVMSPKR